MSLNQRIEEVSKMTAEEQAAALAEFQALPEEIQKEAQAQVDREFLADNLYQYGWLQAEREFATEQGEGDLSKVASAEEITAHEQSETSVRENIETLLADLAVDAIEDECELAKEAQAAAGFIFAGYTDAIEKIAAEDSMKDKAKGFMKKHYDSAKDKAGKAGGAMKAHGGKAWEALKKHKGKAAGGVAAAGALGLGARHLYKKHQEKKMAKHASEMDVHELYNEFTKIAQVEQGLDKLASFASAKGEAARAKLKG
jgi:hypothetical protein